MLSVILRPDDEGTVVLVYEVCGSRRDFLRHRFGDFFHEGRLMRNKVKVDMGVQPLTALFA